jgi:hypothetical protein
MCTTIGAASLPRLGLFRGRLQQLDDDEDESLSSSLSGPSLSDPLRCLLSGEPKNDLTVTGPPPAWAIVPVLLALISTGTVSL